MRLRANRAATAAWPLCKPYPRNDRMCPCLSPSRSSGTSSESWRKSRSGERSCAVSFLTEELLSLPEQVAALRAETERRFQEMAATVDKLAREVARLGIGMGDLQRTQKRL